MQISILGCGWLGLPLAESLVSKGFSVKGSTTSPEKMGHLKLCKITPFLVSLSQDEINGDIIGFLDHSEVLIIDIPPRLRSSITENFIQKIRNIIPFIEVSSVKKILFVSSTSVYGDENAWVTENTIPNPDTESGRQLWEVEKMLQNNSNFTTTILRFGGLIGTDRHPVKQLAGKENVANGSAPVNLIHQEDCIGIIVTVLEQNVWGEIFNAVAPFHPSRAAYYIQKANQLGLLPPQFSKENSSTGKVIASEKTEKKLKYSFKLELY